MTDDYRLEGTARDEFNAVISGLLVPKLIQIADKYSIDRDDMIELTAGMLTAVSKYATFERWGDND